MPVSVGRATMALMTACVTGTAILTGCSSAPGGDAKSTPPQISVAPTSAQASPAPGAVGVSADGVTTAVGAPAESTEEEYFQACYAARLWMDQRGNDPKAQIEPYLAMLQSTQAPGPGTFGTPWSQLPPGRQAAVIVAARAAADALCG